MRVTIFFVSLCFLLLKGFGYSYSAVHYNEHVSSPSHIIHKEQAPEFAGIVKDFLIIKETGLDQEVEYLVGETVEDDDETTNISARKYKLPASCYLTFSCTPVFNFIPGHDLGSWPFFSLTSYKYITQRTLRI